MSELSAQRILLFAVFAIGVCLLLLPGWCYRMNRRSVILQQRLFSQSLIKNYLQYSLSDLQDNRHLYLLVYRGLGVLFLLLILINLYLK